MLLEKIFYKKEINLSFLLKSEEFEEFLDGHIAMFSLLEQHKYLCLNSWQDLLNSLNQLSCSPKEFFMLYLLIRAKVGNEEDARNKMILIKMKRGWGDLSFHMSVDILFALHDFDVCPTFR